MIYYLGRHVRNLDLKNTFSHLFFALFKHGCSRLVFSTIDYSRFSFSPSDDQTHSTGRKLRCQERTQSGAQMQGRWKPGANYHMVEIGKQLFFS